MPRASDHGTFQVTLTERPALMETRIVDGVKFSRHVGQRNGLAAYFQFVNGPRSNFRGLGRTNECHGRFVSLLQAARARFLPSPAVPQTSASAPSDRARPRHPP